MWKIIICCLLFVSAQANTEINRIGVIDTGLDINDPRFKNKICGYKDFTGEGIKDYNGHGTHIAGLIVQNAHNANYCLVILKFFSDNLSDAQNAKNFTKAILATNNLKIVNISGGGTSFSLTEYNYFLKHKKIKFIVAAGNDGLELNEDIYYFPASYNLPNIEVVGALSSNNSRANFSNYGNYVKHWELGENVKSTVPCLKYKCEKEMSGSSQATAIRTGKVIYENY